MKIILLLLSIFIISCAEPVLSPMQLTEPIIEPEEEKEHDYELSGFWKGEGSNSDREFVFMTGMGTGRYQTLGHMITGEGQVFNYFFFHTDDGFLYVEDMDTGQEWTFEYSVEYYGHLDSRNILTMRRTDTDFFQKWYMVVY